MRRLKTFRRERIPNLVAVAAVTLLAAGAILGTGNNREAAFDLQAQAPEQVETETAAEAPAEQSSPLKLGRVKLLLFRRG